MHNTLVAQIFFCPDRQASASRLAQVPTHIAIKVDSLDFGPAVG